VKKVTFYIGANNVDKMVDRTQIIKVLRLYWDSFTLVPSIGVWNGEQEESCMVIVWANTNKHKADRIARHLCIMLEQKFVGVEFDGEFQLVYAPQFHDSKLSPQKRGDKVAVLECVENRLIDGHLERWLHCRMRDGSYYCFPNACDEVYNFVCEEEAEYRSLCLSAASREEQS